jgi:hypothetical protein
MTPIASVAALFVLIGLIELSNSWKIRGWFTRILYLVVLLAVGAWCASVLIPALRS